jgi:hypothetical protein
MRSECEKIFTSMLKILCPYMKTQSLLAAVSLLSNLRLGSSIDLQTRRRLRDGSTSLTFEQFHQTFV